MCGQFRVGVLDPDRILQLFLIYKHVLRLLLAILPGPGAIAPGVGAVQCSVILGQRTVLLYIAFTGSFFQLHIVLEEREGFAVVGMGVQIKAQFLDHKVQGPQLVQLGIRQLGGVDRSSGRGDPNQERACRFPRLRLGVPLRGSSLADNKGDREGTAGRQRALPGRTGWAVSARLHSVGIEKGQWKYLLLQKRRKIKGIRVQSSLCPKVGNGNRMRQRIAEQRILCYNFRESLPKRESMSRSFPA